MEKLPKTRNKMDVPKMEEKKITFKHAEPTKYISLPMEEIKQGTIDDSLEHIYGIIRKSVIKIIKKTDEYFYSEIFKWAKENGYTDIWLIDEEFIKTAFEREIKRRRERHGGRKEIDR